MLHISLSAYFEMDSHDFPVMIRMIKIFMLDKNDD